jgi:hypothetical protein
MPCPYHPRLDHSSYTWRRSLVTKLPLPRPFSILNILYTVCRVQSKAVDTY